MYQKGFGLFKAIIREHLNNQVRSENSRLLFPFIPERKGDCFYSVFLFRNHRVPPLLRGVKSAIVAEREDLSASRSVTE